MTVARVSTSGSSSKLHTGSLVWHTKDGKARIVGQLHSGQHKGGSTSNHVTYCTPGWYLLMQIKKKFKYADFYRTTWPVHIPDELRSLCIGEPFHIVFSYNHFTPTIPTLFTSRLSTANHPPSHLPDCVSSPFPTVLTLVS
ncbi:hypothetical protein L210DRAFT_3764124 [Boletus edulis BED1]|uniref:Uncharacterized protein n=1 Tax=Boletus edulis BED1 TaxID=1328754 RepID=A0AAD4BIY3_BOLED|nr:hypothetical protein L210DRAFT_3764124 [Boletus edulis BED1]